MQASDQCAIVRRGKKKAAAPTAIERILYLTLRNLGDLLANAEDRASRQLCLALYNDALSVDSSDSAAWLRFGEVALRSGDWHIARVALERGNLIHPDHPLILDALLTLFCQARPASTVILF